MALDLFTFFKNIKPGDNVTLPMGEFEGPFTIDKPCTINGNNTTLWAKKGPVISILSSGVTLNNMRIELSGNINLLPDDEKTCVLTNDEDTQFSQIQVFGNVLGIKNEEAYWDIPSAVNLGAYPQEKENTFIVEIFSPVSANIACHIDGVSVSPSTLEEGKNSLLIKVDAMKDGTFIFGDILVESAFLRCISLSGNASINVSGFMDGQTIYTCSETRPVPKRPFGMAPPGVSVLKRGQRIAIDTIFDDEIKIEFHCQHMLDGLDIEPYAFMLDNLDKATTDDKLIFFGNEQSNCKAVRYNMDKSISITPVLVDKDVHRIAVAHSIYGDDPNKNFSKVKKPLIRLSSKEEEKIYFFPDNLFIETTIVSIELYRHNGGWKLSCVGAGYKDGLKRLCESYGLEVSD